jgi:hypothetical protein
MALLRRRSFLSDATWSGAVSFHHAIGDRPHAGVELMNAATDISAALNNLALSFSEQHIHRLFRACIEAAGVKWNTPRAFDLIEQLWYDDDVVSEIEALQDAHKSDGDTEVVRADLLAAIESGLRQPVA